MFLRFLAGIDEMQAEDPPYENLPCRYRYFLKKLKCLHIPLASSFQQDFSKILKYISCNRVISVVWQSK